MSMATAKRKAQIQVITPNMAAIPRLLCNLIVSQWRLDVLKKRALPLSLSLLPRAQCISLACYGCSTCDSSSTGGGEPVNPPTCWQTDRQKKKKPQTEQIPRDRGSLAAPLLSQAEPGAPDALICII